MKAVLFSIGTRGDIEPFLAIAQLLNDRNWDVLCVFPEQFRETVEGMGLPFKGFSKEFLELLNGEDAKKFMGGRGSIFKRFGILIRMSRAAIKLSKEIIAFQHRIQVEENPDRVIYHPKCNYALVWGMANAGKTIMVSPIPFMVHPIDHLTALGNNYGKVLNRLSFWVTNTLKAVMLKRVSRRHMRDKGITVSSIKKAMLEKENTFYAVSPLLFPRPGNWPEQAKVVGYYERVKTLNWQPGGELTAFLERHEKVVFITFGSMTNSNPTETTRIIVDVLKKNNIPALINTSWGGLEEVSGPVESVLFVNNIPYDWVFPKMYAIVHHGGSGTIHAALKYACPSLVVPHILDQFYWGKVISGLHLGPEGIAIKKLEMESFERKLLDLVNNPVYKDNANVISEKMKREGDVDKLYDMIVKAI
ncbi:MAG: glycosyltransferase family 1 protein [Bacteroidetes bacterium]|nr:glycosyltransferase family 1 protein [Bacteroidota bacterium]